MAQENLLSSLPTELASVIRNSNGSRYLNAVANCALQPQFTDKFFVIYEQLIPELASRWVRTNTTLAESVHVISSLAKILPLAPYLRQHLRLFFTSHQHLAELKSADMPILDLPEEQLLSLLLAFFRLFSYDPDTFGEFLHPALLPPLFRHSSYAVRYVAIQCLSQTMRFADAFSETLIEKHIGRQSIRGCWEGVEIDYRMLKLNEEARWKRMEKALKLARISRQNDDSRLTPPPYTTLDLCSETADLAGVLLPRHGAAALGQSQLVHTPTVVENLRCLARALLQTRPILLAGEAGSGKTALISEAARRLNKLSTMVTLQLNGQTDAKSLLGIYASSTDGGSFVWQAGVLTQAMQEGRWVLIEDIDRAPSEVLGMLRPIVEKGKLFLANRKETVRQADGFRLLATTKTSLGAGKSQQSSTSFLSNPRIWSHLSVTPLDTNETETLLQTRFPRLSLFNTELLNVHQSVSSVFRQNGQFKGLQNRLPSLRDLLKWCRRLDMRLASLGPAFVESGIPETEKLAMFKDAADCYAQFLDHPKARVAAFEAIARAMQVPPQQVAFLVHDEIPAYSETDSETKIGRASLRVLGAKKRRQRLSPFALTRQARLSMERIATATQHREPVLLVGETGVGKTTVVQRIAEIVGQRLTVVNLSQQSEASDLLGGLKPVTPQSLILPMTDSFASLFDDTFSARRNDKFQTTLKKSIAQQNWRRVLLLWEEGVQTARNVLQVPSTTGQDNTAPQSKRRKLETPKYQQLRNRWTAFAASLAQVRDQMERVEQNLVFSYVDGKLVEAVRNGEWLLLDEINLASSETVDHMLTLLQSADDGGPFLMLTEKGSTERVVAHPDFRIFAAMNPANDAGKKQLASDLRSRFTEFVIDAGDGHLGDLTELVETYLGPLTSSDKRAASDLAKGYLKIRSMNDENRLSDGAGDVPHFSLRSLVRCLQYVKLHAPTFGLRRSMYEGFAMSFLTMLSAESENLVQAEIKPHILAGVKNVRSFLSQVPKVIQDDSRVVNFKHHKVLKGNVSTSIPPHYILTPSVSRNVENLARAASMHRFPVLLQGPTSAGKTSMVEYLAQLTGNKFVRINNHEHTDIQEYLGAYGSDNSGKLQYCDGVLVDALRHGHWIVLDELNLAPSDVLEALNRLLDDNRELFVPETQEVIKPHPNFMLFATQNPAGLYGGRKQLSRAFRNRFLELHFHDIPESELEVILTQRSQIAPSYCAQIVAVYKKLSLQRQTSRLFEQRNSFATLRDLFRWAARPADNRQQLAENGFMLLAERVRNEDERRLVKSTIQEVMRLRIDDDELYSQSAVPKDLRPSSDVVWTSAMRRLFVLVSRAVSNNEPVLLVGDTGCGKTQICQVVAEAMGRPLNTYNAHSNTETGDLIGSQRPIRNRSDLAKSLREKLNSLLSDGEDSLSAGEEPTIDQLLGRMDAHKDLLNDKVPESVINEIAQYRSLFQWVDGSLVSSMKHGQYFLLDEISLAEDSVLERLNSVLEPTRTILLAEKGSIDNEVRAASGFQFLATMNPGGDYGKRELSAALRNRLTEIWVPPLTEDQDILPILRSKLGDESSEIARSILKFANWFQNNAQGSATATLSLRSLLAWADFMTKCPHLSIEAAFVNGAAMFFIDSLGTNAVGLIATISMDVNIARGKALSMIGDLFTCDAVAIYEKVPSLSLQQDTIAVGDFAVHRISGQNVENIVFDAPTTMKNLMRLVRALQMSRPILLEGSPGVGKTAIVTALAKLVGKVLTRINLSDQTDLMDLFGADVPLETESVGRFSWRDGPLLRAMQSGGWVLLDEMNLASQSVLEGLNSCLDHRQEVYVAELDRTFVCHPEFKVFAAQNPHSQGGGRKGLPASFVNRFIVVFADSFQKEDLRIIAGRMFPDVDGEVRSIVLDGLAEVSYHAQHDHLLSGAGGPWEFNLRDLTRWFNLVKEYGPLCPMRHADSIVLQRFRTTIQREKVAEILGEIAQVQHGELYYNLSRLTYQIGTAFLQRHPSRQLSGQDNPVLPRRLLPYAQSMITAINQSWPIIISSGSGSGKSILIQHLAAMAGAELVEFSLNADVDTMDLIGGFEQYDQRREFIDLKSELIGILEEQLCVLLEKNSEDVDRIQVLLEAIHCSSLNTVLFRKQLRTLGSTDERSKALLQRLDNLTNAAKDGKARFAWNDGVLVDAIQRGSWLVLENANLCNPSVLDRLNSLLEPDGKLIISEHLTADRAIKPHPNFRIFLTLDPRHGELSRAMRNRSLEVHLVDDELQDVEEHAVVEYSTASAASRVRLLGVADNRVGEFEKEAVRTSSTASASSGVHFLEIRDDVDSSMLPDMVAYALDHLTNREMESIEVNSLKWLSDSGAKEVARQVRLRSSLPRELFEREQSLLQMYCGALLDVDTLESQPMVLAFNQPLIDRSGSERLREEAEILFRAKDILFEVSQLREILMLALETTSELPRSEMTLLQQSTQKFSQPGTRAAVRIPPIHGFVKGLCDFVETTTKGLFGAKFPNMSRLFFLPKILRFGKDLMKLAESKSFDRALFQAHLMCGYRLASTELGSQLGSLLQTLGAGVQLKTGRSIQQMWSRWRPKTPSCQGQLSSLLIIESLIKRFDTITKHSRSPRELLVQVRPRLLQARSLILNTGTLADDLVDKLEQSLEALQIESSSESFNVGHFRKSFEWMRNVITLAQKHHSSSQAELVALFSRRPGFDPAPPVQDTQAPVLLQRLADCVSDKNDQTGLGDASINVGLQLIVQLQSCQEQNLGALDYAQEEFSVLAKSLLSTTSLWASELDGEIIAILRHLVLEVLVCHEDLLTDQASLELNADLPVETKMLECVALSQRQKLFKEDATSLSDIVSTWSDYLMPTATQDQAPPMSCGTSLINFAIGLLRLFVPDQPYDPSMLVEVVQKSHMWQVSEKQLSLQAMRRFQQRWTGENGSLVIEIVDRDLAQLGSSSEISAVVRPEANELSQVHSVFSNLLQTIVYCEPEKRILSNSDPASRLREVNDLRKNVTEILNRLSTVNRAYDDICKPVEWVLKVLCLGLVLVQRQIKDEIDDLIEPLTKITKHVPMLGSSPSEIEEWHFDRVQMFTKPIDLRSQWLEHASVVRSVSKNLRSVGTTLDVHSYFEIVDSFYNEWKSNLTRDQAKALEKSRYYAYRGGDDDEEEILNEEQEALFPTFEGVTRSQKEVTKVSYDARANGIKLAELQMRIFGAPAATPDIRTYILQSLEVLSGTNNPRDSSTPIIQFLPGMLLQMEDKMQAFGATSTAQGINIYSDADVFESKTLQRLVTTIEARFRTIGNAWPEHAIPQEVLQCCTEIYQFTLKDPVAKLLTKTEKLFDILAQWQAVASRQYSAQNLQDDVAKLIIHWRQLELSSWARLLDRERVQHEQDAKSWYFILYEAVIVNPQRISEQGESIQDYLLEIAQSLEDFLRATTLGQFGSRLLLLQSFRDLLTIAVKADPAFEAVERCVSTTLGHFARFQAAVEAETAKGWLELEKAVQEQIKLASWKDTNPRALKQSAQRSHNKLFRIVRKYRVLLSKPVVSWTATFSTSLSLGEPEPGNFLSTSLGSDALAVALVFCEQNVTKWKDLPERFRNPLGASESMRRIYRRQDSVFNGQGALSSFRHEIIQEIKQLRDHTPNTLTEDNQSLVRHLKERKRKLFADSLKYLVNMGIRRNLGSTEIESQSSNSKVIAISTDLKSESYAKLLAVANEQFHAFLDIMPSVRQALSSHAEELKDGEVRRSVGLAEGLLSVLIQQRNALHENLTELQAFRTLCSQVKHLESIPMPRVALTSMKDKPRSISLVRRLAWIPRILELSMKILGIQFKYAGSQNDELLETLSASSTEFRGFENQIKCLVELPEGFINLQETALYDSVVLSMFTLKEKIEILVEQSPGVKYICKQILPWLESEDLSPDQLSNGVHQTSAEDFSEGVRHVCDQIFVALQNVQGLSHSSLLSDEEPGWMTKYYGTLTAKSRALNPSSVTRGLEAAFESLRHIHEPVAMPLASVLITCRPILEQYSHICSHNLEEMLRMHFELSRLATYLAKSFATVATEGFCSPAELTQDEEKAGQLEAGTGLGEGEGAEDISKDVGDDEDISELAQADNAGKSDEGVEASKDAVDLDHDDLNGEFGDEQPRSEDEEGEEGSDQDAEDQLNEETGSVDDLDPSAVDEKLWDEMKESEKELKNEKAGGSKDEEMTAAEADQKQKDEDIAQENGDDEAGQDDGDSDEGAVRPEAENMDPHAEQEDKMDLPEEMQLNGEEKGNDDDLSDDMLDELSDMEDGGRSDTSMTEQMNPEEGAEVDLEDGKEKDDEQGFNEQDEGMDQDEQDAQLQAQSNAMQYDLDDRQQSDARTTGGPQRREDQSQKESGGIEDQDVQEQEPDAQQTGTTDTGRGEAETGIAQEAGGRSEERYNEQNEALKKIAEVLDEWYQRQDIFQPNQDAKDQQAPGEDIDLLDADFEHVQDDADQGDAQASGTAGQEHDQEFDQTKAIEDKSQVMDVEMSMDVEKQEMEDRPTIEEQLQRLRTDAAPTETVTASAFIPSRDKADPSSIQKGDSEMLDDPPDVPLADKIQSVTSSDQFITMSYAEAERLWSHYSIVTHAHALLLTEQLRLILSPTLATKLSGDFRTGKRLNIKRIIPYIASQYKRDKIWMRRSVPSKRNYQIMIAVDDSKSMMEGGAGGLAFETLAMLCKSLSMLEVGDLCVVGFGSEDNIRIAHPFGQPFGAEAGADVIRNFSFGQEGTNVRKLVAESTRLFQDARATASGSQSELWQLELIISDGICEDHDTIQRLVRHASQEKIMLVFVIVDSAAGGNGTSILDLTQASFEEQEEAGGEMKLTMRRYLESFPFPYYLVVRDVRDLPGVLATALKGWFREVVDVQR